MVISIDMPAWLALSFAITFAITLLVGAVMVHEW